MQLSEKTISLLKNFSGINQSILFKEGNKLRTISVMKNILAEVQVDEEFERDFGIYDLNQFLNSMSLFKDPQLDFKNESYVTIREGNTRSKYFFADPAVIVTPPDKSITLPSEDVAFSLNTQQLDKLLKAAAVYGVPDLSVVGETKDTFTLNFKVENIKVLPGAYDVVISRKLLSRFQSEDKNLTYYIALEPDSTYDE